ncbi:MAG: hypothetical protein JWP12_2691 [Bacteroidetes bacterium]|nr:hypothetical protein [Bacteroidota bacterium]
MKKHTLLLLLSLILLQPLMAKRTTCSVQDAEKQKLINLTIKSKGGFTGPVISMTIASLVNDTLILNVEAGRRLDSQNNTQQDILVTKSESFALAACQQKMFTVSGMCCQLHNHAPAKDATYSVGKMAEPNLVKVAAYIDQHHYYSEGAAQHAVWVVSDNQLMASICSEDEDISDNMRDCVGTITGQTVPHYSIIYCNQSPTNLQGDLLKIEGRLRYTLDAPANVTIGIYNSEERMVQLFQENQQQSDGKYNYFYTFDAKHLAHGKYFIRLQVNGQFQKQEEIVF